jgi:hypothetical protein
MWSRNNVKWQFVENLTKVESKALSLAGPVDITKINPKLIPVSTGLLKDVFDYWRLRLSSAPQREAVGAFRGINCLVLDQTSNKLLGLFSITALINTHPWFQEEYGWADNPDVRLAKIPTVFMIRRCLPIYEFGQARGGKFIALMACSQELVRQMERQYSYRISMYLTLTLKAKASQYNRLHGFDYKGQDHSGKGMYLCPIRKGADNFLERALAGTLSGGARPCGCY